MQSFCGTHVAWSCEARWGWEWGRLAGQTISLNEIYALRFCCMYFIVVLLLWKWTSLLAFVEKYFYVSLVRP